jgi:acyl carrier protein
MEDLVKKIISDKFKLDVVDSTLISDFVEDSFSKVEMLFEIEQSFGVRLGEEDILSIDTVGDLIQALKNSNLK